MDAPERAGSRRRQAPERAGSRSSATPGSVTPGATPGSEKLVALSSRLSAEARQALLVAAGRVAAAAENGDAQAARRVLADALRTLEARSSVASAVG